MNILLTGPPGIGKTTLLDKIKDRLEASGYSTGGVYCPEIMENGARTGFSIIDIASGRKGTLSSVHINGPSVGKYHVNLEDLEDIGILALSDALKTADYIFIDEIAPMELKSPLFSKIVWKTMESDKTVLAVIHQRSQDPFILKVKNRDDVVIFNLSSHNRDDVFKKILDTVNSR